MIGATRLAAPALGAVLAACAPLTPLTPPMATAAAAAKKPAAQPFSVRFVDLIGPVKQHDPPFLGVPYTNFYCLRSFLDRETGATAHQLYVADSYFGAERHWAGAHDAAGQPLPLILIDSNKITCENGCAYADEFAATLPEALLQSHPQGLAVTFTAASGETLTIALSGDEIARQLAAVAAAKKQLVPQAAAPR